MLIHLDRLSNRLQKRIQVAWRAFDEEKISPSNPFQGYFYGNIIKN